jgi:hypothetical protein
VTLKAYPTAASVAEAREMLAEHEAVRLPDGVLWTRVDRLPAVTGGEVPLHMADQIGAFIRENHNP